MQIAFQHLEKCLPAQKWVSVFIFELMVIRSASNCSLLINVHNIVPTSHEKSMSLESRFLSPLFS